MKMYARSVSWIVGIMIVSGCSYERKDGQVGYVPNTADRAVASSDGPSMASVSYSVVDEKVTDTPLKTQIEQHVVAAGVPSESELRAEILRRYLAAKARRGFRYNGAATNIYIYVYGTKEQATAGQGLWIGMIAMGPLNNEEPKVAINQARLVALSQEPQSRFGLSEKERRMFFRELGAAEVKAAHDAQVAIPDTQLNAQVDLERELVRKYEERIAEEYGLTAEQLEEITVEGLTKGWPF